MISISFLIAGLILAPIFAIIETVERRNSLKNTGFLMHDLKTGRWYE
jgi:hypothetical protein